MDKNRSPEGPRLADARVELSDGKYCYTFIPEILYIPSKELTQLGQEIMAALGENVGGLVVRVKTADNSRYLGLTIKPNTKATDVSRAFDILRTAGIADLRITTEGYQK